MDSTLNSLSAFDQWLATLEKQWWYLVVAERVNRTVGLEIRTTYDAWRRMYNSPEFRNRVLSPTGNETAVVAQALTDARQHMLMSAQPDSGTGPVSEKEKEEGPEVYCEKHDRTFMWWGWCPDCLDGKPAVSGLRIGESFTNTAISIGPEGTFKYPLEEGIKHDSSKPPLHLIPPEFLYAIADILDFGARKYAPRNWEKGMNWSRVYRAAIGHLFDWFSRKGPDPETGKSHLWHAACCIMFLVIYELRNSGTDDRP